MKVPSKAALVDAASVLVYESNRPGVRADRQAAYLDAASILTDLALLAGHGDFIAEVQCVDE